MKLNKENGQSSRMKLSKYRLYFNLLLLTLQPAVNKILLKDLSGLSNSRY